MTPIRFYCYWTLDQGTTFSITPFLHAISFTFFVSSLLVFPSIFWTSLDGHHRDNFFIYDTDFRKPIFLPFSDSTCSGPRRVRRGTCNQRGRTVEVHGGGQLHQKDRSCLRLFVPAKNRFRVDSTIINCTHYTPST